MAHTTRREFLGITAAASSFLVARGSRGKEGTSEPVESAGHDTTLTTNGPLIVVTEAVAPDINPRGRAWPYIEEILGRAGLFFDLLAPSKLESLQDRENTILLLAGDLQLTPAERTAVTTLVENGAGLIGMGGTSGLDNIFGVRNKRPLAEGWVRVTDHEHPVTSNLRSSLHVFGGFAVQPGSATSLADVESGRQGAKGSAIVENQFGKGRALLLAPDLIFSIIHIQQGVPVFQDAQPAPDGSAELNDGELKAEDGLVLDWERDRTAMPSDGTPVFLEPISDELRAIVLRSVLYSARNLKISLPLLWYWPRNLPAVGHISHDTDGHDPDKARALLEVMNHSGVKSTWCTLYPGGYPQEFYDTLKRQGFEIALHYDARSGGPETSWSKENFLLQHRWLKEVAGLKQITSNKNHYTRWESRLDFLRWCEEVGIQSDQTRGPSKQGTIGFPLGGCQPYFPWDDEVDPPRLLKVLEINMLTQDLVVVCPSDYGATLVDSVVRQHGVAHFLFHPAHIQKPNVAAALAALVDYGREQGLEWWTSEQIVHWEQRRRDVRCQFHSANSLVLRADQPLGQATLLFLRPATSPNMVQINDQPVSGQSESRYGFDFDAVTLDLAGTVKLEI